MTDAEFFELLRNYFTNASTAIEATINNTIINRINDLEKKLIKLQYQQTEKIKYTDKYHSLEDEFGCPLETVFKALTNGIWIEEQNFRYYTSSRPSKMMKGYITDFRIKIEDFEKSYFNITVGKKLCFNWRDDLWLYDEKYILDYRSHELYKKTFAVNDIDTDWDNNQKPFTLNSYKKNWWLREDKSE